MIFSKEEIKKIKSDLQDIRGHAIESISRHILETISRKSKEYVELFKIFLFYEERSCQLFSMEDAIKWFKIHLSSKPTVKGGIYLESNTGNFTTLHLFFIDGDEPLIDGNHPHLFVKTLEVDQSLSDLFADQPLIIIE